jgi:hypothetical protein
MNLALAFLEMTMVDQEIVKSAVVPHLALRTLIDTFPVKTLVMHPSQSTHWQIPQNCHFRLAFHTSENGGEQMRRSRRNESA